MTFEELMQLTGNPPAMLPDGKMGLLIRWPSEHRRECGFQVPGEEDIRWYSIDQIGNAGNGALVVGANS